MDVNLRLLERRRHILRRGYARHGASVNSAQFVGGTIRYLLPYLAPIEIRRDFCRVEGVTVQVYSDPCDKFGQSNRLTD
jgi:hypothetical protein